MKWWKDGLLRHTNGAVIWRTSNIGWRAWMDGMGNVPHSFNIEREAKLYVEAIKPFASLQSLK